MTFDQWWQTITPAEQKVIGVHNARFVWDQARAQPEQEPVAWRYLTRYPTQNVWTYCGSEPETKPEREPLYTAPPHRKPPQFPTMLRKMWSGTEVQEWINENWSER